MASGGQAKTAESRGEAEPVEGARLGRGEHGPG